MRLPTSRPYMSGNAAMTVSISSSATRRFSVSVSMMPCMIHQLHSCTVAQLRSCIGGGAPMQLCNYATLQLPHVDIHRLPLRVRIQRLQSQLAPHTTFLHAAERRLEVHAAAGVDRQISRLDRSRRAQRPAEVARPDRSG